MTLHVKNNLAKGSLVLALLALSSLSIWHVQPAQASGPYSVNILNNYSFEGGADPSTGYPVGWGNWTHHDTPDSSLTPDCHTYLSGQYPDGVCAARLDIGRTIQSGIGFIAIFQVMPSNTFFSNVTDRPDGLDVWFYILPKYNGTGDTKISIIAQNAQELDYVLDVNPYLSYPNQTFSDGRPSVKSIFRTAQYQTNGWFRFTANIYQDWQAPMDYHNANGTVSTLPGFPLDDVLYRLEFDNIAFRNDSTCYTPTTPPVYDPRYCQYFANTQWVDLVRLYLNTNVPPPPLPGHYANFNFTDTQGDNIDSQVQWRLFNSTGSEIPYVRGESTLPDGSYTLSVYYPTYQQDVILSQTIALDANTTIHVPVTPIPSPLSGYVAINNIETTVSVYAPTPNNLTFTAHSFQGNSFVTILKVPSKPTIVWLNGENLNSAAWAYDPATSTVRIPTSQLGTFILYFGSTIQLPATLQFNDRQGNSVNGIITWQIVDSTGHVVCNTNLCLGQTVPDAPDYVEAYYGGSRIYRQTPSDANTQITLQMIPITIVKGGYLILNTTLVSATIDGQLGSRISFTLTGSNGAALIVVNVPTKPVYVEKDGKRIFDWTYDPTAGTAAIPTDSLGTFTVFFKNPSLLTSLEDIPTSTWFTVGIAATLAIVLGTTGFSLKRRKISEATAEQP